LVETLRESVDSAEAALRPVASALAHLPEIAVHRDAALRLKRGQSVLVRGREPLTEGASAYATSAGLLIATGSMVAGELVPHRVFNL
jgi:tRNA pseudouridine55 synthase